MFALDIPDNPEFFKVRVSWRYLQTNISVARPTHRVFLAEVIVYHRQSFCRSTFEITEITVRVDFCVVC